LPLLKETCTVSAPDTTWLLVTISPPLVITTPEPVDSPDPLDALISTTLGLTSCATRAAVPLAAVLLLWAAGTEAVAPSSSPRSFSMPKAVPPPMTAAPTATAVMSAAGLRMRRRLPPCDGGPPPGPGPSSGNVAYGGTTGGGGGTGAPGPPGTAEATVGNVAVSDGVLPDAALPKALPSAGVP
jgi:hypothetical protein